MSFLTRRELNQLVCVYRNIVVYINFDFVINVSKGSHLMNFDGVSIDLYAYKIKQSHSFCKWKCLLRCNINDINIC